MSESRRRAKRDPSFGQPLVYTLLFWDSSETPERPTHLEIYYKVVKSNSPNVAHNIYGNHVRACGIAGTICSAISGRQFFGAQRQSAELALGYDVDQLRAISEDLPERWFAMVRSPIQGGTPVELLGEDCGESSGIAFWRSRTIYIPHADSRPVWDSEEDWKTYKLDSVIKQALGA